jgi:hypothetical protein
MSPTMASFAIDYYQRVSAALVIEASASAVARRAAEQTTEDTGPRSRVMARLWICSRLEGEQNLVADGARGESERAEAARGAQ